MNKETAPVKVTETQKKSAEIIQFPQNRIVRMPGEPDAPEMLAKSNRRISDRMIDELTRDLIEELQMGYDVDVTTPVFQKDFSYAMECVRASIYRSFNLEHPFHDYMDNIKVATLEEIAAMKAAGQTTEITTEETN